MITKYSEMINEEKVEIEAAGIAVIWNKQLLLVHGTGYGDDEWTIPKGEVDPGENLIEAAIRELEEEIGVKIDKSLLKGQKPAKIVYRSETGKKKRLNFFEIHINDLSEIGLDKPKIDKTKLQLDEVDKSEFFTKKKVESKLDRRMADIIHFVDWN